MNENLKLIGASEEELHDPRIVAALAELESPGSDAAAARAISEGVTAPPIAEIPLAARQHGLEQYGLKLRRKTNIHDLFIQRVMSFGIAPSPRWLADFQANDKTKGQTPPEKIIPETYLPSVFIFILAAPFAMIDAALAEGEQLGFFKFIELVDAWIADTGIPTDKTADVWLDIQHSLSFLEKLNVADADKYTGGPSAPGMPTLKKSGALGS